MEITFVVEIDDAQINLENYEGCDTVLDAVKKDVETYNDGEISLEELIYAYVGGDITVSVQSVHHPKVETDGAGL